MLKKLFYASASILMLALAYHLGVRDAAGQSSQVIEAASVTYGYQAVVGRVLRYGDTGSGPFNTYPAPIPGTSPVIVIGGNYSPANTAMLANGDIYERPVNGVGWNLIGNILAGSTPAAQQTFGQVKAQYRK